MEVKVNAYFVHMLQRAREVHAINNGETGRDSPVKCPFCVADEDEAWFRVKYHHRKLKEEFTLLRTTKPPAPHCEYCPLKALLHETEYNKIMDNCVEMGFYALRYWEDTDE
jgi:hypothetical protein